MSGTEKGAALFGTALIALLTLFFLKGGDLQSYQYNIVAVFAALCAGMLVYFLSGTLALKGKLPEKLGGFKVDATGGVAFGIIVLALFIFSRPAEARTIAGNVYTGSASDPREAVENVAVTVSGTGLSGKTDGKGWFTITGVSIANPQLVFTVPGAAAGPPVPEAADHRYYLNLPVVKDGIAPDEGKTLRKVGTAGPTPGSPAGSTEYELTATIARPPGNEKMNEIRLELAFAAGMKVVGKPTCLLPSAGAEDPFDAQHPAWDVMIGEAAIVKPVFRFSLEGRPPDPPAASVGVKYRFRLF